MFRIHNRRLFWRLAGRSIKANLGRHLLTALAVFLSTLMLFSIFTIGVNYFRNLQVMMDRLDFLLDSMVKLSRLETGSIRLQAAPSGCGGADPQCGAASAQGGGREGNRFSYPAFGLSCPSTVRQKVDRRSGVQYFG